MDCANNNKVEQAQQAPALCANQCGFFASSAGLCSKCFRDAQLKQQQQAGAQLQLQQQQQQPSPVAASPAPEPSTVALATAPSPVTSSPVPAAAAETASASGAPAPTSKGPTRCSHPECKKKVGLTGFKCKCELVFCSAHRLAEDHDCIFDHKSAQRQKLAAANPIVQAAKVQKI